MKQKRFIKLFRAIPWKENDIQKCVDFMKIHNGVISYKDFTRLIILSEFNLKSALDKVAELEKMGVNKITITVAKSKEESSEEDYS